MASTSSTYSPFSFHNASPAHQTSPFNAQVLPSDTTTCSDPNSITCPNCGTCFQPTNYKKGSSTGFAPQSSSPSFFPTQNSVFGFPGKPLPLIASFGPLTSSAFSSGTSTGATSSLHGLNLQSPNLSSLYEAVTSLNLKAASVNDYESFKLGGLTSLNVKAVSANEDGSFKWNRGGGSHGARRILRVQHKRRRW
ncbi:hypothetical protein Acr_15g0012700 [Actinidia rufa]|uniref:Uncharacterized protein n=1 Tax=Actinidia rufa TaxID=165716 RepID=A0A7J0FVF1_9ERIC|nr:hypothetical protein Acr_15g0012700 [Actinidia rufa]